MRRFNDVASLRSDWRSFWSWTDTWLASMHVWFLVFLGIRLTSASWVFFIFLTARPLSERRLLLLTMFRVQTASSHKAKLSIRIIFWSQWLQLSRLNTLSWISRSTKFTSLLACQWLWISLLLAFSWSHFVIRLEQLFMLAFSRFMRFAIHPFLGFIELSMKPALLICFFGFFTVKWVSINCMPRSGVFFVAKIRNHLHH